MIPAYLAILPATLTGVQGQAPQAAKEAEHPHQLPIGVPGRITPSLGYTSAATGQKVEIREIVEAAKGYRFVLLGESHDNPHHHQMQADIIRALAADGRDVSVGMEMFTRDNQKAMAPWSRGMWTEAEFIEKAQWKTQWGFDFALYKPIFDAVKELRLPLAALNLPRDWVRRVGREGAETLTSTEKKWAPDINLDNKDHRRIFTAMIGGHPLEGKRGDNMLAAMIAWDEGMAQSALDFMSTRTSSKAVMVIVVGSGHMMYGQGINYRLSKKGHSSLGVLGMEEPLPNGGVSRGLAEFFFVSPKVVRKE